MHITCRLSCQTSDYVLDISNSFYSPTLNHHFSPKHNPNKKSNSVISGPIFGSQKDTSPDKLGVNTSKSPKKHHLMFRKDRERAFWSTVVKK